MSWTEVEELPGGGMTVEIPPVRLEVRKCGLGWELFPKVPAGNLLRSLAHVGHPEVAEFALKIIFELGDECDSLQDALSAYTTNPLQVPPDEYLFTVRQTDWSREPSTDRAVVLAGLERQHEIELLLRILDLTDRHLDDGSAILAASASNDKRFMLALARTAMHSDWHNIQDAQQFCLLASFRRWWVRDVVDVEDLRKLTRGFAWSEKDDGREDRFIKHLTSRNWD